MTYQQTAGSADRARELPRVRSISPRDLWDALAKGFADFWAMPTHVIFLTIIYPIAGVLIAYAAFGYNLLPIVYPMAAGFALLGPFMRDRPLRTEPPPRGRPRHRMEPCLRSAAGRLGPRDLGARPRAAGAVCGSWILVAQSIYTAEFGNAPPPQPRSRSFTPPGADHASRPSHDPDRQRRRLPVRARRLHHQCRGVPAADRSRDRRHRGGADLGPRGAAQSAHHGAMGPDRCALLLLGSLPFFLGLASWCPCSAMRPGTSIARSWSPTCRRARCIPPRPRASATPPTSRRCSSRCTTGSADAARCRRTVGWAKARLRAVPTRGIRNL